MSWLTLCILVAQCAVILFSWVVASLFPDLPLRSLLTGSGLRWLFGHITQNMSLPLLVDVMLFCIGAGAMLSSGLWHTVVHGAKSYNERMARRMAVVIALMACVTVLLLTALPHAVLLNISGTLFPSSFSRGIVPIISVTMAIMGECFHLVAGRSRSVVSFFDNLTYGIRCGASLLLCLMTGMQLYAMLCYVLEYDNLLL